VVYSGGDDIHGTAYTIGGINEYRRKKTMDGAKMQMDEAIETLKELQLSDNEIADLLKNKLEQGGEIPTLNKKELDKMENKIDTSIQTNAFIETELDNEPTLFDSVNSVKKFEYGGSITDIGNWNDVPNEWRNIGKISKSNFNPKPTDKGFQSFIKPFLGVDEINPRFLGVNYDDKNIVATNGHILIVMPNTTDLKGILSTRDLKNSYKIGEAIDQQYVNYEAVIPVKAPYSYKIDCYKLYQFIGAAMNYANQTTYQVVLKYDSDKHIGFNGKLLLSALKSCIQLGYESVYVHLDSPNRAVLLTPKKEYDPTNVEEFLILVMPVMVSSEMIGFSGINIDYNRSLLVNFQLDKNEIVNADGSIAKFQMDYGKGELFNEKDVDLLNKIRPKKATLPILENIAVRNGELMATDLDAIITIKQDKAKDGIYGILNGVPYIDQSVDLDEFPINLTEGKKKLFDVDTQFFKWIVGKTLNYISNDELRPAMTGFNLKKTTYGNGFRITIGATDAHVMLRYDITDYLTNVDSEDFDVIVRPKHLYALCDYSDKETLEVSLSQKEKRAYFTDGKATLEMRFIDERYPNIEQVIPYESKNTFELSTIDVKDIVSSKVIKDFKKNPSSYNSSGVSVYGELNDEDKVIVYAVETESERSGYRSAQKVVRKEKIGEYDILYNADVKEETDINISLIMPIMVEEGISGNVIFSFNPKFLEEVTTGVKSSNIKFGYNETNRAYIIQGDALKYVPLVSKSTKKMGSKPIIEPTVEDLPIVEPIIETNITETTQPSLSEEIENLKELLSYSDGDIKQALLEEIEGLEEIMKYDLGEDEEKETIDIGNNFSIVVEKVRYTDGSSTYGCSLNYEGELFKYFTFVSNQTKKDALQNVYNYLKTLSSGEAFKDRPRKGQSLVFYKDRGNSEVKRVFEGSNSFKEATQFVNDIKSISSKTFAKGGEVNKKGVGSNKKDHLVINSKDKIIFEGTEKECNKFCDTYLQDYCRVVNYWDLSNEKEYYYEQGGSTTTESEEEAIMREQFGNKQF
jgi:DNA polymerase III sliding clamp (beta) subunit (PCNA family)